MKKHTTYLALLTSPLRLTLPNGTPQLTPPAAWPPNTPVVLHLKTTAN